MSFQIYSTSRTLISAGRYKNGLKSWTTRSYPSCLFKFLFTMLMIDLMSIPFLKLCFLIFLAFCHRCYYFVRKCSLKLASLLGLRIVIWKMYNMTTWWMISFNPYLNCTRNHLNPVLNYFNELPVSLLLNPYSPDWKLHL